MTWPLLTETTKVVWKVYQRLKEPVINFLQAKSWTQALFGLPLDGLSHKKMSPIKTSHNNYSKATRSMRAKADLLPNCYLVVADESIHELLWTTDEVKVGNWMHGMRVVQGIFLLSLSNRLPQKSPHQVAEILIGNNINRMAQKEKEQFILH